MIMSTHLQMLVLVLVLCLTLPSMSIANDITNVDIDDTEDGYVYEDMSLIQNDQPEYHQQQQQQQRFHHQRPQPSFVRTEHKTKLHIPPDIALTKEVLVKQGKLRGVVRTMHAQNGLRDVDQYIGIPYAASPTGNGRFMPPGKKNIIKNYSIEH